MRLMSASGSGLRSSFLGLLSVCQEDRRLYSQLLLLGDRAGECPGSTIGYWREGDEREGGRDRWMDGRILYSGTAGRANAVDRR